VRDAGVGELLGARRHPAPREPLLVFVSLLLPLLALLLLHKEDVAEFGRSSLRERSSSIGVLLLGLGAVKGLAVSGYSQLVALQ